MPTTLHEPRNVVDRLSHLQSSAVVPTLGEIYRALKQDLAAAPGNELRMEIAEQYDKVFASRQDYALWRREFGRENPTTVSGGFPTTEDLVREGLLSHEPVVVWGVLSMTHGLATSRRGTIFLMATVNVWLPRWKKPR